MSDAFIVYFIGVVVGIVIDNIFWYALAKIKEEQAQHLEKLHDRIASMRKHLANFVTNNK